MEKGHKFTQCWDCAKATGGCSWSQEYVPVEGWEAIPTRKKTFDSFLILDCPEFERDAILGGLKRVK